jgi:XTP/dITP diphosphohydrolase
VKLLIATRNPGKLREYAAIYAHLPLCLTSLSDEGIGSTVRETGKSYRANAILKAEAYVAESGLLTIADDSGLEVDALEGDPGVRSSRYAGEGASDEDRCRLLLDNLGGVPWEERTARFRCVVAIAIPGEEIRCTEGTCEGIITFEPKGIHGFGYDPIFFLPDYGCTMAELPAEVKNRISHRAKAARAARPLLEQFLAQVRDS